MKLESFKNEFNPLFWDFIWYCNIHNLDYSIILPYLNKIEQLSEIRYIEPNKEILQIRFNNKLYKRNENVIYDIRSNNNKYTTDNTKKTIIIKQFKLLVIKQEISVQFGRLEKNRNRKNVSIYIDHINKIENLRNPSMSIYMKQEIQNMKNNNFQRAQAKMKNVNIGNNSKLPDISSDKKRENKNDISPLKRK